MSILWLANVRVLKFTVDVDLVDHLHELGLCWVLAQRPHDHAQLFGGDVAVAVLVEQLEGVAEL